MVTIAKELDKRSLRIVGLFSIKYLTSEKDAVESFLIDYRQLVKLTEELQTDKNVERKKRDGIHAICKSLCDARIFINAVALLSALDQAIAPYHLWSQKMKACTFERDF